MASRPSDLHGSLAAKAQLQGTKSATDDLFSTSSTLFSPSTPVTGPGPKSRPVRRDTSESDSEFGAFVSVPAMQDPLSTLVFDSPPPSQNRPSIDDTPATSNSSLTFFDKFAQDAKVASDRNKQGVLDELLNHEDDPLYWLRNERGSTDTQTLSVPQPDSSQEPPVHDLLAFDHDYEGSLGAKASETTLVDSPKDAKNPLDDLLDLDHDFFASKPTTRTHTTHPDQSPSRSSTLALPVTPAPPLADTHNVSFTPSPPTDFVDPFANYTPDSRHASSYSSLSNISSRWMSLLPSSKSHQHHATPSLEHIFAADHSNVKSKHAKTRSQSSERPSGSTTLHRTASHPVPKVEISHGTPFARPIKNKASPFASHSYIPPTGAPGYRGEQYNWDKGFSEDLERELTAEEMKEHEHTGRGGAISPSDVGHLIERRTGGVDLIGRRASTAVVLDLPLADLVRPHLPALARLPRKWTLIYSLDQHGISLNTLYERCEAHMQVKPGTSGPAGALVVIKDAGDGIFGAWMGKEGVHPSRGKGYYGSGDSFLWKYVGGRLQVFKWTGKNDYVALCEPGFISFGGGDGNYGLYLDDTLYEGSSAACPTFANEPLCSPGRKNAGVVAFECVGLEVWGVGP